MDYKIICAQFYQNLIEEQNALNKIVSEAQKAGLSRENIDRAMASAKERSTSSAWPFADCLAYELTKQISGSKGK